MSSAKHGTVSELVTLPRGKRLFVVANQMPVIVERNDPKVQPTASEDGASLTVTSPDEPSVSWNIRSRNGGSSGLLNAGTSLRHHTFETFSFGVLTSAVASAPETTTLAPTLREQTNCIPIFVPQDLYTKYYRRCCKKILWPFMHLLESSGPTVAFDDEAWAAYVAVNKLFAERVASQLQPGDVVWIHDYHLMLMPQMLRKLAPDAVIGFFLHTPWPPSELYRRLPVRTEILKGLLFGPNLIGLQTYDYARQLSNTCLRILGASVDTSDPSGFSIKNRDGESLWVAMGIFPVGLDVESLSRVLASESCQAKISSLSEQYHVDDKLTIVGCDRLDVIKGLTHKLRIFDMLLTRYPEYVGRVELVQLAIPHEHQDPKYAAEVSELVLRINGQHGSLDYQPIQYLHRRESVESQLALFAIGDVCFVSAIRDGMNMTSAEFIACSNTHPGAVVLSEFCGTAGALSGALLINPWDYAGAAEALHQALSMTNTERSLKHKLMYDYILANNNQKWGDAFVRDLLKAASERSPDHRHTALELDIDEVVTAFKKAKHPLLLLDYDGTLTKIVQRPELASPPKSNLESLATLNQEASPTETYVISGRDRDALENWLGELKIGFSAEHGAFLRKKDEKEWSSEATDADTSWQDAVLRVFEYYTARTPGSLIERKSETLTWHYRQADEEHGIRQARELCNHLESAVVPESAVEVLRGSKNIEVRPAGINKGVVVKKILSLHRDTDFVVCAGDDHTDEDMFQALRTVSGVESLYTVLVGDRPTSAKYRVAGTAEIEALLHALATAH